MKITVKTFATFRELLHKEIEAEFEEGATIGRLLDVLCARFPGLAEEIFSAPAVTKPYVNILKNGRNIHFIRGLDTHLEDGDIIAMVPPAAGG